MGNIIEYSHKRPSDFVPVGSRYSRQNVIYYGENRLITFDTYIREPYVPTGQEKVMLLTKGYEYRPDLLSSEYYGFVENWWRILEANGMKDIMEFKAGVTIILPDRVL